MRTLLRTLSFTAMTAALVACVTINVYFPEAAAERAADRFIQDVIGENQEAGDEVSMNAISFGSVLAAVSNVLVPVAHAQSADQSVDIDIESPQIDAIKQRMSERHRQHLADWYEAGAIGLDSTGLVEIRDRSAVSLSERRELEQVVAAENADRRAVYREIAVANGHPEWEDEIRRTFAERWIANAKPGWYYQNETGQWVQK